MNRAHPKGRGPTCCPAVVWTACVVGALVSGGCAGPGQYADLSDGALPAACSCQANAQPQSQTDDDRLVPLARPMPHTLRQALRGYLNCLRSPLAQRGPAMNVGGGPGYTGVSRNPPAEGERTGGPEQQRPPSMAPSSTGVSRNPPAEGERGGSEEQEPAPAPADSNSSQGPGDVGVSRFPPAEGERTGAAEQPALPTGNGKSAAWYSAHAQATVVTQDHDVFPSPYVGPNSLLPREHSATSMTGTVFLAARVWESEHTDGQVIFNPEIAGGTGFSGTTGIAGFPNGEITRVGIPAPTPYLARLYLRQTFGFGGARETATDDINQVAGERDVHRLAVIVGKLAAPDLADDNRYAHDPRTQFLNWALVYNGAWDYPANVRGYTYGVGLDYNTKNWSWVYGVFAEPAFANGAPLDPHILKAQGQVTELETRYKLWGRQGSTRVMGFLNHAHMGKYSEALAEMPVNPDITLTRSYRYKYGFGLSLDQELTDDLGFFSRLGWNDGHSESFAYTEIDRTASAGLVLGGRCWCRPYDRVGLAGVLNGLSGPHRDYLAAGGLGFIIGDGRLNYGLEEIMELYYALQVKAGIVVTFDFQEVGNPAYNRDRGPVSIGAIRVHWDH